LKPDHVNNHFDAYGIHRIPSTPVWSVECLQVNRLSCRGEPDEFIL
jgi:hypothetical protein